MGELEIRILYLCDGKACGNVCPNTDCKHTYKPAHALHKDADIDGFGRIVGGENLLLLVEPSDNGE